MRALLPTLVVSLSLVGQLQKQIRVARARRRTPAREILSAERSEPVRLALRLLSSVVIEE